MISGVFNLADESCSRCEFLRIERDSTIRVIPTSEIEIQELKERITKISEEYQRNTQTLQRRCQSLEEKYVNLAHEHKAANKKHQEEIKDLHVKNKKLLDNQVKSEKVTLKLENKLKKSQREFEMIRKDFACENDSVKDYQQKFQADSNAKNDLLRQKLKSETPKRKESNILGEKLSDERSRSDNLKKAGVHRLILSSKEMPGRKWLSPHCRPPFKTWILFGSFCTFSKYTTRFHRKRLFVKVSKWNSERDLLTEVYSWKRLKRNPTQFKSTGHRNVVP